MNRKSGSDSRLGINFRTFHLFYGAVIREGKMSDLSTIIHPLVYCDDHPGIDGKQNCSEELKG